MVRFQSSYLQAGKPQNSIVLKNLQGVIFFVYIL